jgi:hypothetical protein
MTGVVLVVTIAELLPPHPAIASTAAKRTTCLEKEIIADCTLHLHARLNDRWARASSSFSRNSQS